MNERGVEVLVKAALSGRRQIRYQFDNGFSGVCALGALGFASCMLSANAALAQQYEFRLHEMTCPECGRISPCEEALIVHLNDGHGWSFLDIARKLGPA